MDKLRAEDIPAALGSIIQNVRIGLRKVREDNVALVQAPDKIDFDFTVILRKDDLVRSEVSARDPTTTTNVTDASTDVTTRGSNSDIVMDETESMSMTRTGGETGGETGVESGGQSGGQDVSHSDSGGEIEVYSYLIA